MSSGEGLRLRSRKIIDPTTVSQSSGPQRMAEPNIVGTESVGESSVTSQIAEITDSYDKKIIELQSEKGQLRELMIAMMEKSNGSSTDLSGQGSSKQSARRSDR